jgi:hypothetical protein
MITSRCTGSPINLAPGELLVESVEKVPKRIFGQDAGKSDFIEYATINDLILGKGH